MPISLLTNERIARMMSGNRDTATYMGRWDKIIDHFRTDKKHAALNTLFDMVNNDNGIGKSCSIFLALGGMAVSGKSRLFTIAFEKDQVSYCINGQSVKRESLRDAGGRETVLSLLGKQLKNNSAETTLFSLENNLKEVPPESIEKLLLKDFQTGGVHKRFEPETGVLLAIDQVGIDDFKREKSLQEFASNKPDLQRYISTQEEIPKPPGIIGEFTCAKVKRYKDNIQSQELDKALPNLSKDDAKLLAIQLVDMARAFYCGKLSHRDLHMHNLLVLKDKNSGAMMLQAIDFGHSKFDDELIMKDRLTDISYFFERQARSAPETILRNHLRFDDAESMQKHYPLHKLIMHAVNKNDGIEGNENKLESAKVNNTLEGVGKRLKANLLAAGEDEKLINQAFENASIEVQMSFNTVNHLIADKFV